MAALGSFGAVSYAYAFGRKGFPASVFRFLEDRLPQPFELVVDAACGTGIATRQLREELRCEVVGVERDPEMLAHALPMDGVRYVRSSFEDLHRHSVMRADAVTVFSAFHWFAHEAKAVMALVSLLPRRGCFLVVNKETMSEVVPEYRRLFEAWIGAPLRDPKAGYRPHEVLACAGFAVERRFERITERYSPEEALALLKSKHFWNQVPEKKRPEAEAELRKRLAERTSSAGEITREVSVQAVLGIR